MMFACTGAEPEEAAVISVRRFCDAIQLQELMLAATMHLAWLYIICIVCITGSSNIYIINYVG